jgi:hypothetical protein
LNPRDHIPPGYLFLCPLEDLLFKDSPTCFRRPDCRAYCSFDPSGTKRLSAEEAWNCGFPNLEFRMKVLGRSWENAVYAGLRQFHEAKGFDPYSREVALELGYPLFRVSCEPNAVLAHSKPRSPRISIISTSLMLEQCKRMNQTIICLSLAQ